MAVVFVSSSIIEVFFCEATDFLLLVINAKRKHNVCVYVCVCLCVHDCVCVCVCACVHAYVCCVCPLR